MQHQSHRMQAVAETFFRRASPQLMLEPFVGLIGGMLLHFMLAITNGI